MGIDIDSFLDKFNLEENKNKNKVEEDILSKLDFQKGVEENLMKIEKKASSSEFEVLKNIYTHVKSFDSDLTSKFLDISSGSKSILKNLGDNYSDNFYKAISNNILIIEKELNLKIEKLKSLIKTNDFNSIFKLFNDLLLKLNDFPEEFTIKKIEYLSKIKLLEIEIFSSLTKFKKNDLIELRTQIKNKILILNKSLILNNLNQIRNNIKDLNSIFKKIPIVFTSDIILEKTAAAKIIIKAETFIKKELESNFELKVNSILNLFTKFQKASLDRDLNSTITIYDEILIEFNSLPNIFLKEKIKLFKEINIMYGSINDLLIKDRASMFLESYNYSKILDEVRNHLDQIKRVGRVNINILKDLENRLLSIPDKYAFQKNELLNIINLFKNKFEKVSSNNSFINKKIENKENKNNNWKQKTDSLNKKVDIPIQKTKQELFEEKIKFSEEKLKNYKFKSVENLNLNKKESIKEKVKENKINNEFKNKKINNIDNNFKKIELEVNKYFLIIKNSNDVSKVKIAYKKILFYIDLLQVSKAKKLLMKSNVKKLIRNKRFT